MRKEFPIRGVMISLAALAAALPSGATADTLGEAMQAAVDSNPALGAARQRLQATREALPLAWAEALPQISLSASAASSDSYGALVINPERAENWSGQASGSQLLFGSGRVLSSTRAARAQIRAAAADYDFATQQLLLDVAAAYADVRQQQAFVAAREQTVANLSRLFEFAEAQFEAGVVTRTDVAQSQARLAQARTQLVQSQGALAAAIQAYMRLVGRPPTDLEAPSSVTGLPADLDAALADAVRGNPLLLGAQAAAEQADANVDAAAAQGRWRVTLEGTASIFSDFEEDDLESSADSVGVRFSLPFVQGGAIRARTRQQRALRAAANLDVADAQRAVEEGVTNAWTGLASARAAVVSARDQVQAAELAYEGVLLEQETGLRSTVEVLDQEQDLLNARLALAQAERNLVVAERFMLAQLGALTPQ